MGLLDCLIDKNAAPVSGVKYIYAHNKVWKANPEPSEYFDSLPIERYRHVAKNVVKINNNSFEFDLPSYGGERYRSNYGWSLVVNTPDNIAKVYEYEEAVENCRKCDEKRRAAFNAVESLKSLTSSPIVTEDSEGGSDEA